MSFGGKKFEKFEIHSKTSEFAKKKKVSHQSNKLTKTLQNFSNENRSRNMSDTTTNNASTTTVNNEVAQNNEEVSLPTLSPSLFFFLRI